MKSDEWIIEQLLKRQEEGLSELIEKYAPLLKSVTRTYLYALPDYQDECLNDIFFAIWENISAYDQKSPVSKIGFVRLQDIVPSTH